MNTTEMQWRPVPDWSYLIVGDTVWEIGRCGKVPKFYGPFEVVCLERRVLRNAEHREFTAYDISHFIYERPVRKGNLK